MSQLFEQLKSTFQGKKVFVTGHTGFKGSWLIQLLSLLGATVKGYALAPEKEKDLFVQINGHELCYSSVIADINDLSTLRAELVRFEPDFVFHLAAQALVRRSYASPLETFQSNVMGTAHVLEALRSLPSSCVAVLITTDKVYENPEDGVPFVETDKLGGYDPYSASKAACEIVIDSYRRSFFQNTPIRIASARAGNVIGGGDYSDDRIIPDIVQSIQRLEPLQLRNPNAIRPWQHVIEPLVGYLQLAEKLAQGPLTHHAFNFGPEWNDTLSVREVVDVFTKYFGSSLTVIHDAQDQPHEAHFLKLDNGLVKATVQWLPKWSAEEAIRKTAEWYSDKERNAIEKCTAQIQSYFQ
jgi:CDP-glucose 4,6-dehydratase